MFERFKQDAIKSIMLAQQLARETKHNFVGMETMLVALSKVPKGIAAQALSSAGVSEQALRREFDSALGIGKDDVVIEIPFSTDCKRALECSWTEAKALGDNFIDTEHLLLGILLQCESSGDSAPAVRMLKELSVTTDTLRREVAACRRGKK